MSDFNEAELHNLLTAVADQRTYWKQRRAEAKDARHAAMTAHEYKANDTLYKRLQTLLLAHETAETL